MTIILPCQITSPPLNLGKWTWSPFRLSPSGWKPPNASTKCKPPTITPKPTSPTDSPSKLPKRPPITCTNTSAANWALAEDQGKRYSWGYPAIPELEDHRKVFELLPAEKELGMQLSPRLPVHPRTIHRRDHCPPCAGKVLQHRRKSRRTVDRRCERRFPALCA